MSSISIIRIILVTILFIILLTIYKINRVILLDKRISRYSLKRLSTEDISLSDKFLIKTNHLSLYLLLIVFLNYI